MIDEQNDAVKAAASRVIELGEEVEAGGYASVDDGALAHARTVLHAWVDELIGIVNSPGLGRVTLIHGDGRQSTITSPDLPFRISTPVNARS